MGLLLRDRGEGAGKRKGRVEEGTGEEGCPPPNCGVWIRQWP